MERYQGKKVVIIGGTGGMKISYCTSSTLTKPYSCI
jgi:hypothetical protein